MIINDVGIKRRLRKIRALILDVDGVMTDGSMYYSEQGQAMKKFSTRDGMGLRLVQEAGLVLAIVTGDDSEIVRRRAEKLKITDVYMGVEDKLKAVEAFLAAHELTPMDALYVGDDINDIAPMEHVNIAVAVADAAPDVLKVAHLVTERKGGDGAVREVCDVLLANR